MLTYKNGQTADGGYLKWINELTTDQAIKDATIKASSGEVAVSFFEYDWSLNSQADPGAAPEKTEKAGHFGSGGGPDE